MAPPAPLRRAGAAQVPAHAVTEDTPADMLTGQMSLSVLLPDGRHWRINVDRGTPMMDLLIQVATANKISPGGHVIQVISDRSHGCLSYKPSTPIGTLDTTALRIVPKNKINELPSRRTKPPPQDPLADAKIRIKVYLPRNQLSAMRVSPKTPLAEVLDQICKDKNLDVSRYELRHPVNVDERLRPSCCLADYKLQEVTVVPLNSRTNTVLSSADIIAMQKKSDGKRKIFAIFGKKSKPSAIESTASSDSLGGRSVSPDGSDGSAGRARSLSPLPAQVIQPPPRAKKRAAPKPPQLNGSGSGPPPPAAAAAGPVSVRPPSELSEGAESVESRQSSDSSGYHEAGLSDAPDSPTEQAPAPAAPSNLGAVCSHSTSNLASSNLTEVNSTSTVSLSSAVRKRRAPPPPAIPRIAEDPPVPAAPVASQPVDEQQPSQSRQQPSQQSGDAESKPSSSPGSACSTPEGTPRLKAPLGPDSGTSSTETLTADPPAPARTGKQPAPPAPATEQTDTTTNQETEASWPSAPASSHSATPVQSGDQSRPAPKSEPDPAVGAASVVAKPEPDPSAAAEPEPVPSVGSEVLAPVAAGIVESRPEPVSQPPAQSEGSTPAMTAEQHNSDTTVEGSAPKEAAAAAGEDPGADTEPAPVILEQADSPEPPAAAAAATGSSAPVVLEASAPGPSVTGSSAPVVLEAPAPGPSVTGSSAPVVLEAPAPGPSVTGSSAPVVLEAPASGPSVTGSSAPVVLEASAPGPPVTGSSAPVVLEAPAPGPSVTGSLAPVVLEAPAPGPLVTGSSAPVVLEAPAPVLRPEAAIAAAAVAAAAEPVAPAVVSDTLPAEPRLRQAAATPISSGRSSVEPPRTPGEPQGEDCDTARLQREVDSALACLDSNLDEALAEAAEFTDSANLPTESRLRPPGTEAETGTETALEESAHETLPVTIRETPNVSPEASSVAQKVPGAVETPKVVSTSRETVQETREVIETLLPVARTAVEPVGRQPESSEPRDSPAVPPAAAVAARAGSQRQDIAVVAEVPPRPAREATQAASVPEMLRTAAVKSRGRTAPGEPSAGPAAARDGPAAHRQPTEVLEEVVVERAEKVQRNRMTSRDIQLHIERKLAEFGQSRRPARCRAVPPQSPQSAAAVSDSARWQYQLPAPPTPFQDGAGPLEAPLEFQDSMTATSSEASEAGQLTEATNGPLMQRIGGQSEPVPPPAHQSEPAVTGADQWEGGSRPERPQRRRSSERLSRQMSFSIGAYGQRQPPSAESGPAGGLQKADSFHCQKSAARTDGATTQVTSCCSESGDGPERAAAAARRPAARRRSSDAADRAPRPAETGPAAAGEPVRPPRKYELKFNSSRSHSMLNLSNGGLTLPAGRDGPNMNKTLSHTDLAIESEVSDIQSEFLKLQRQFLHWQQQLLQNQSILQTQVAPLAAGRPPAAASLQGLEVIEELHRRAPDQSGLPADRAPAPAPTPSADYASRSQSLPRGAGLQHANLSLAEQPHQPQPQQQPAEQTAREPEPEPERTPPRQRAATLERTPEAESEPGPGPVKQRASTLERRPSQTRERRVPWSPPKVALGTWADQARQSRVQLKEDRDYVLRPASPAAEQGPRRSGAVSVRPSRSVTVTSLGAPPPPVGVPPAPQQPQPQANGSQPRLSAVAKVRHNETVSAPTAVLRGPSARRPAAFSISDSKPAQPGGSVSAAAGRFTSVVSLTEQPRQPHAVSVQVSKPAGGAAVRPAGPATVTCRVAPPAQSQCQSQSQPRAVPSVVSVTRKDSALSAELTTGQSAADGSRRHRQQPVVKGFRQSEVPPPPPPPPPPVLPAAAGRTRLKPVPAGRPAVPKLDPREELMIAIREHGGLKKRGGVRP